MPHAPLLHQSNSLQDALETALAGHLIVDSLVDVPQLARTPARVCVFEPNDLADHCLSKLFGVAQRTAGELAHALISIPVKALPPLVAGLGADPVLLAQLSEVLGVNRFQYKFLSLVHRFYFFPRHPADYSTLPAMCYLCSEPFVLPMY